MADDKKKDESQTEESIDLSKDGEKILDMVEKMSVLELSNLVKALEDKFGVSASAPAMAVAAPAGGEEEEEEQKSSFDVVLAEAGGNKIAVIKAVKGATGVGLKEAKDMVESAPTPIKEGIGKEEAEKLKGELEDAGATVELK